MPSERLTKSFPSLVTKVDAVQGIVEAIVSVFGIVDYGDDVIVNGAFVKTIVERGRRVRVLNSHNSHDIESVIGKPLAMRELSREELPAQILAEYPEASGGLWTQTQYLLDTEEGAGAFARIKAGAVDEYSIGFECLKQDYGDVLWRGEKRTVRFIREIKLWEYSPVVWGMNPATVTVGAKSHDDTISQLETALADVQTQTKAGRVLSEVNVTRLQSAYEQLQSVLVDAGVLSPDGEPASPSDTTTEAMSVGDGSSLAPFSEPASPSEAMSVGDGSNLAPFSAPTSPSDTPTDGMSKGTTLDNSVSTEQAEPHEVAEPSAENSLTKSLTAERAQLLRRIQLERAALED